MQPQHLVYSLAGTGEPVTVYLRDRHDADRVGQERSLIRGKIREQDRGPPGWPRSVQQRLLQELLGDAVQGWSRRPDHLALADEADVGDGGLGHLARGHHQQRVVVTGLPGLAAVAGLRECADMLQVGERTDPPDGPQPLRRRGRFGWMSRP
jgi:hypothetical protein